MRLYNTPAERITSTIIINAIIIIITSESPLTISVSNAGGEYLKVVDTVYSSKARNYSLIF